MKKLLGCLLLGSCLMLQSCFEIIEQVFVKNDGSGTFQLVINMSKSKTKLNSILKMKQINGHDVPTKNEITQKLKEAEALIKKSPGISKVTSSIDFDNFITTISCSFNKVASLNEAVKNLAAHDKDAHLAINKTYDYNPSTKSFTRLNQFSFLNEYKKMSVADREIFATANYTSIFRFESDITNASNKDSKLAGNKKAVMLKFNTLDVINNKKSIENTINLTK